MIDFVRALSASRDFGPDLVQVRSFPAAAGKYADLAEGLSPALSEALQRQGISRLYSHQAEAIDRIRRDQNVLVVTPTASGKSLIYILPTFERVIREPGARALYLFPYKALEQDQLKAILSLGGDLGGGRRIRAEIYDGDTPASRRKAIKADPPDILITNPDMLHLGLLAYHDDWREFFSHLRLVVLDELHVYKGIFGCHLHHILVRLRRVADHHGTRPRFVASSATIANPDELGTALTGEDFALVDDNGAPRAAKHIAFLNPAVSAYTSATKLIAKSLSSGYRTIAFTKARKITELIHSWLVQQDPKLRERISSYRAGYLPEERREIERRLVQGDLWGVISTSALELGVDIGGLDVCVLVGYPGSIVSSWQRIGRVGREDRESLTCLVGMPDALDQYFMREPEEFFRRGFERVVFDPANRVIAADHLVCAGAEIPLTRQEDEPRYAEGTFDVVQDLERQGGLVRDAEVERWYSFRRNPQRSVNLRGIGNTYTILRGENGDPSGRVIGTVDAIRAFHECHDGAIYLHLGQQFLVRAMDVENRKVRVAAVDTDYYTVVKAEKQTEILATLASRVLGPARIHLGRLKVTEEILGYEKRRLHGRDRISSHDLELPPIVFETVGLWIELPEDLRGMVVAREGHFMGGIHATEHAAISLFPLLAICDRNDIGGISYPLHPQLGRSAIFIYDGYPGGVGLAAKGYDGLEDLLERTRKLIEGCPCEKGCPSCIHSPKCGNGNQPLDKKAALLILRVLTGVLPLERSMQESPAPASELLATASEARREKTTQDGRVLYFDLETLRSAEEVGGWENTAKMGMSVGVVFEEGKAEYRTYREADVERLLLDLVTADRVIGFNIDRFDLAVLSGYTTWDLGKIRTFDMMGYIYSKLGFRLKLDSLAETTLGERKSADGLQALAWVKEGRFDLIEEYCRKDVEVTRSLHRFGVTNRFLLYHDREGRKVRLPVEWT
ncbi:MAG: DEAD/DEAH box helicase [Acidobacteria bacterium]|nr:DEAD/DEAH box helicase [Acidobacteriota bacterium]